MKISDDVLAILSQDLAFDGAQVKITRKLDRNLYTQTNKVLEACGGKWNRKAQAHVFPEDAEPLIEAVLDAGEVRTKSDLGFFATPPELAEDLVVMARPLGSGSVVLEPSAGDGAIVRSLLQTGARVIAVEIDAKMAQTLAYALDGGDRLEVHNADFFAINPMIQVDAVVMNPPFARTFGHDCIDHVRQAFDHHLGPGGTLVSVLPAGVKFRQDRRHTEFRDWVKDNGGEITDLPDLTFRASGTDVRTCVLRIVKR